MAIPPARTFEDIVQDFYSRARSVHGDHGLSHLMFSARVDQILDNHLGPDRRAAESIALILRLHTNDLYLSMACAGGSESAWRAFIAGYARFMNDVARFVSSTNALAMELAESTPGHIFMPDQSGRCRISRYDGRVSLATWLRAVIKNRALDQQALKSNSVEGFEFAGLGEPSNSGGIEQALRANRYQALVTASLKVAVERLTAEEKRLLVSRYVHAMKAASIAEGAGVHPSTVTRQMNRLHEKLRDEIMNQLQARISGGGAVQECIAEILENPRHSILALLE